MNAVEIEEAVSELAEAPFEAFEFPFAFLSAFGNKETTVKRLRSASANSSDVEGGVLQRNNIHIAVCPEGQVSETLTKLRASPKTATNKAKFILATDGLTLETEDLNTGEAIACEYSKFADHFGFFLPLAGISTVGAIKNNPIDIKATGRLNKLYVELLRENPDWATEARRTEMNQFMARLIFCFFAEDTGIFRNHLFTHTIKQMSDSQSGNTHEVLAELFFAMDMHTDDQRRKTLPRWADAFPYVNGGLFTGGTDCPRFSRIARSYLLRAAELNWQEINPDIFGSMIQAVADDEERGELGMHYTSVPNILKVLNPLFLDDLREQLEAAGDNQRKLRNLRKRLSTIRVFDPACGSGNFLVIAYIRMREIEHEIVKRTGDLPKSWIPLFNFYGIEIKGFAAEIARLALLIAEFQCDVRMISQQEARLNVLPLHKTGQISTGNALRMNWLAVCPPTTKMEQWAVDLFGNEPEQSEIEFDAKEGETFICGNPPYKGRNKKVLEQKADLATLLGSRTSRHKSLDYVGGWLVKLSDYLKEVSSGAAGAIVCTKSLCQGEQVSVCWPIIFEAGNEISFCHTPFKWSNLASHNAGVTVVVIGLQSSNSRLKRIYEAQSVREVKSIGPYLVPNCTEIVSAAGRPLCGQPQMYLGNMAKDGGNLIFSKEEARALVSGMAVDSQLIKDFWGAEEVLYASPRACLWIEDAQLQGALENPAVRERVERVRQFRLASDAPSTRQRANISHRFVQLSAQTGEIAIVIPAITSENRPYLPVDLVKNKSVIGHKCFAVYDSPIWTLALIASRLHWVWIGTVCVRMRTDFSYSNTLGWNTFPIPSLTEKNKADLKRCAEDILLARESHFPATIADLYDPEKMPADLRAAHERNDETLERIYIGRLFRNDTERLEKLFDLYTKMTTNKVSKKSAQKGAAR